MAKTIRRDGRRLRIVPTLWEFGRIIGERRAALGLTHEEVARRAGIRRTSYGQLESGAKQGVSYATVRGIAAALETDAASLWELAKPASDKVTRRLSRQQPRKKNRPPTVAVGVSSPLPTQPDAVIYDIPIMLTTHVAGENMLRLHQTPVGFAPRTRGIDKSLTVYALRMPGDSMEPAFSDGELLYVDSAAGVRPRDFVLLEIAETAGNGAIWAVRRLISASDSEVVVEHFQPSRSETTYVRSAVRQILHILTLNELMGVT